MTYHPSNLHKLFAKDSAEARGFEDALAGRTANPESGPRAALWVRGYDYAEEQGLAVLPRFAALTKGISRFNKKGKRK